MHGFIYYKNRHGKQWEVIKGGHVEGVGNEPGAFLINTRGRNHDTVVQHPICKISGILSDPLKGWLRMLWNVSIQAIQEVAIGYSSKLSRVTCLNLVGKWRTKRVGSKSAKESVESSIKMPMYKKRNVLS
jgi:hypothetical protein